MITILKKITNQKEKFDKLIVQQISEIMNFHHNDFRYQFKRNESSPKTFSVFHRPLGFLIKIRDGHITLQEAKIIKETFNQI